MKKYITLAALLAAGTACANASYEEYSSNLMWTLDTTNSEYDITTGEAWSSGTYSPSTSWGSQDFTTMPGYLYANGDQKVSLEGNAGLKMSDDFSLVMNADITGTYATSTTDTKYWLLSVGESAQWYIGVQYDTDTRQYSIGYNSYTMSDATSYGTHTLTGEKEIVLVMDGDGTGTAGVVTAYVDGEKVAEATMAASDRHANTSLGSGVAFMNYMGEHDGVTGGLSGAAMYNTVIIPEPSAFGMLAGLGALALVASRRRRK